MEASLRMIFTRSSGFIDDAECTLNYSLVKDALTKNMQKVYSFNNKNLTVELYQELTVLSNKTINS